LYGFNTVTDGFELSQEPGPVTVVTVRVAEFGHVRSASDALQAPEEVLRHDPLPMLMPLAEVHVKLTVTPDCALPDGVFVTMRVTLAVQWPLPFLVADEDPAATWVFCATVVVVVGAVVVVVGALVVVVVGAVVVVVGAWVVVVAGAVVVVVGAWVVVVVGAVVVVVVGIGVVVVSSSSSSSVFGGEAIASAWPFTNGTALSSIVWAALAPTTTTSDASKAYSIAAMPRSSERRERSHLVRTITRTGARPPFLRPMSRPTAGTIPAAHGRPEDA
jgi:hypothetical protein